MEVFLFCAFCVVFTIACVAVSFYKCPAVKPAVGKALLWWLASFAFFFVANRLNTIHENFWTANPHYGIKGIYYFFIFISILMQLLGTAFPAKRLLESDTKSPSSFVFYLLALLPFGIVVVLSDLLILLFGLGPFSKT